MRYFIFLLALTFISCKSPELVTKYGVLTEYNRNSADNHIEKTEFNSGPCFGNCPVYQITINNDKSATLSDPENGQVLKTKIKDEDYNNLTGLLNYLDFTKLKDKYYLPGSDHPTGTLKITYNNGNTKTIEDYGMAGTHGLKSVYSMLSDFRFNQSGKKYLRIIQSEETISTE